MGVRAALLAAYLFLFALESADSLTRGFDIPPRKDAHQYVTLAYNLERYGVFSLGMADDPGQRVPTAFRPPAYPALLAAGLGLSPSLDDMTWEQMLRRESQARLWPLKAIHAGLLLASSLVAMAIVRDVTGSVLASYACLFLVGLDPSLQRMNQTFVSEPLATFLLAGFSFCMVRIVRGGGPSTFAMGGCFWPCWPSRERCSSTSGCLPASSCWLWRPAGRHRRGTGDGFVWGRRSCSRASSRWWERGWAAT